MTQLRSRMVVAAMAVALLPAVPLSVLVSNLLERSFQVPLVAEVEASLEAALADSRDRLRTEKLELTSWADSGGDLEVGMRADDRIWVVTGGVDSASTVLSGAEGDADSAQIDEWIRRHLGDSATGSATGAATGAQPGAAETSNETRRIGPERVGDHLIVAVRGVAGSRILLRPLPAGMRANAGQITETLALLRGWQRERGAVLRGYVWPFVLTYALLLGIAAVVGMVLARRIAQPVEALAAAAHRVGAGDLSARVEASESTGEVGELVRAFNRMVEELDRQRRELSRLERVAAWRDLARSLAHEIKNPLTPIQLAVQQLGDQVPDDTDPRYIALLTECVEIVNEEVAALRRLVREFSEFARLPEPHPVPGDVAALLNDLGRLYGARVRCDLPSPVLLARIDEAELRRALINLIDNGLAACAEADRTEEVTLEVRVDGDLLEIRVTDQGCGVPPENRERIFEPDFSTKSEGMGLGLAIVDGIIRGHGSTIQVESEAGQGTTFHWQLPVAGGES